MADDLQTATKGQEKEPKKEKKKQRKGVYEEQTPGPEEPGCYLIYKRDNGGTFSTTWRLDPPLGMDGVVAFFRPIDPIPSWKFRNNGNEYEVMRGVNEKALYCRGFCNFLKQAIYNKAVKICQFFCREPAKGNPFFSALVLLRSEDRDKNIVMIDGQGCIFDPALITQVGVVTAECGDFGSYDVESGLVNAVNMNRVDFTRAVKRAHGGALADIEIFLPPLDKADRITIGLDSMDEKGGKGGDAGWVEQMPSHYRCLALATEGDEEKPPLEITLFFRKRAHEQCDRTYDPRAAEEDRIKRAFRVIRTEDPQKKFLDDEYFVPYGGWYDKEEGKPEDDPRWLDDETKEGLQTTKTGLGAYLIYEKDSRGGTLYLAYCSAPPWNRVRWKKQGSTVLFFMRLKKKIKDYQLDISRHEGGWQEICSGVDIDGPGAALGTQFYYSVVAFFRKLFQKKEASALVMLGQHPKFPLRTVFLHRNTFHLHTIRKIGQWVQIGDPISVQGIGICGYWDTTFDCDIMPLDVFQSAMHTRGGVVTWSD